MKGLMLALVGVAMIASVAEAQTGRHLALGVGLGFHKYVDSDFTQKSPGPSIVYRLALKPGVTVTPVGIMAGNRRSLLPAGPEGLKRRARRHMAPPASPTSFVA